MTPHFTSLSHARLCFINDEWNTFRLSKQSKLLEEVGSGSVHIQRRNWLNNDSRNILTSGAAFFDLLAGVLEAAILLSDVGVLVLCVGVEDLWAFGNRPIVCGNITSVCCGITAAKSGDRTSVGGSAETEHAQVTVVALFVSDGEVHDSCGQGNLISSG